MADVFASYSDEQFYGVDKAAFTCMKQQKGIKIFVAILLIALIFMGFLARRIFSNHQDELLLKPLQQGVRLDWPAVGYAAIGTMEDGLLACSSNREKLCPTASMAKMITALAIMEKQPFKPGQEGETYSINGKDIASLNG